MNYHIMIQDKFLDSFIDDVYEIGEETNNVFWFRGNKDSNSLINTLHRAEYIGNNQHQIKSRLLKLNQSDRIFVHFYDTCISEILYDIPNKIYVILWGGEFYQEPIFYHAEWLFDEYTLNLFKKYYYPKITLRKNVIKLFKNIREQLVFKQKIKKEYLRKNELVGKIDYLIGPEKDTEDLKRIKELYPKFNAKLLPGFYEYNYDFAVDLIPKKQKVADNFKIMVGNSINPTNNHIDAFNKLKTLDNIELYCPMSYGSNKFVKEIEMYGKQLFNSRFFPIYNFMSRHEYIEFLNSIDLFFMYHNRQQAWGNIATALSLGKPVFLKKNNPLAIFIQNIDLNWYDAERIGEYDLNEVINIEKDNRLENQIKLKGHISKNVRLQCLKNLFRK